MCAAIVNNWLRNLVANVTERNFLDNELSEILFKKKMYLLTCWPWIKMFFFMFQVRHTTKLGKLLPVVHGTEVERKDFYVRAFYDFILVSVFRFRKVDQFVFYHDSILKIMEIIWRKRQILVNYLASACFGRVVPG